MRQIFGEIGWEKKALVFFSAIVILTLLGPFGTYQDLTTWERLVFWIITLSGVGFFAHATMIVCLNTPYLGRLNHFSRLLFGAVTSAIPGSAVVIFVNMVFGLNNANADSFPYVWFQVATLCCFIGLVEYTDWGFRSPKSEQPAKPVITKFHERLPSNIGTDIVSLSMQDHYVEATTTTGNTLCLIRMSDAVGELSGCDGLRVHRSHWVATKHVVKQKKTGQRNFVVLSDGRELPVSETYIADLETLLRETHSHTP